MDSTLYGNGIMIDGNFFPLDRLPEEPRFSALPRFQDAYEIDPAKWQENDQLSIFDPPVLYQKQNGCVGHGGSTAFTLAWLQSGQDVPSGGFSPTFLYALINGGRDRGAMIGDLVDAMVETGEVTDANFPESEWFIRGQLSAALAAEAALYQADEIYAFATNEECGAALSRGFAVADSVMVGRTFDRVNPTTGLVGVDSGPGNHCVCKGGLRKLGGQVQYLNQNSWSESFGIKGRFTTTKDHIQSQRFYSGVAIKSVKRKPGSILPPVAR